MNSKRATQKEAKKLVQISLNGDGSVNDKKVRQVIIYLKAQPAAQRLALFKAYKRMLDNYIAMHSATIEIADALQRPLIKDIAKGIKQKYGLAVTVVIKENRSLMAGVKVTVGDTSFDTSIMGNFEQIKHRIG